MAAGRTTGKKKAHCKIKKYKRSHSTKCRSRDIDQIQDDIKKGKETGKEMSFEVDEDLPGLGQFYCIPCGRHFMNLATKNTHLKTKVHKRRMKDIAQEQYTQNEAERGASKSIEVYQKVDRENLMKTGSEMAIE